MMSPARLDRYAEELNRDGICVIRSLLPPSLIQVWADAFATLFRERAGRPGGLAPRETARFYVTLPWREPFDDPLVFANPVILGVLDRVMAQEYVMVQLAADTPLQGSEYQPIHRDFRPLFSDDVPTPLYALAVNVPLVEVTGERGPFEMARRTHRGSKDVALASIERGEIAMEAFLMQPGDVIIRTPLALHRGTPNRTDTPRPMVVLGYVMHWLHTPKVDLQIPREAWAALSEPHRRLLRCEVVDRLEERPESYVDFKY